MIDNHRYSYLFTGIHSIFIGNYSWYVSKELTSGSEKSAGIASSLREPKRWVDSSLAVGSGDPSGPSGPSRVRISWGFRWGNDVRWSSEDPRHLLGHWHIFFDVLICVKPVKPWDFHGFSKGRLVFQRVIEVLQSTFGPFWLWDPPNSGLCSTIWKNMRWGHSKKTCDMSFRFCKFAFIICMIFQEYTLYTL